MVDCIGTLAAKAAAISPPEPGDYMQDGLLYCGHCATPKQCRIVFDSMVKIVACQCACTERRYMAERRAEEDRQRRMRINDIRADGIRDKSLAALRMRTKHPNLPNVVDMLRIGKSLNHKEWGFFCGAAREMEKLLRQPALRTISLIEVSRP